MNENIVNFLNGYMMNPEPQYAVFLKGKWGCGKRFADNFQIFCDFLGDFKKKIYFCGKV